MKTAIGALAFLAFWAFAQHDSKQDNNLAQKAGSTLVQTQSYAISK